MRQLVVGSPVGRFKAIDQLRKRGRRDASVQRMIDTPGDQYTDWEAETDSAVGDDRLRLIFICCHPALSPDAQAALTLREVCGLTTEAIAAASIVDLDNLLLKLHPSPVIELNRAEAIAMRDGPSAGIDLIEHLETDGAQAFYSAVIGWHIAGSLTPGMDYRVVHATDDESGERLPAGALAQLSDEMKACGAQPVWLGYIAVDAVDASVNRSVAAGGAVSMPATDIADVGRIALVTDPQGAPFYLMRAIHDVPSAAFAADRPRVGHCAWNELASAVLRALFMAQPAEGENP